MHPGGTPEWNKEVAEAYLSHVQATVNLLARYGIYTLLDMHQDVYNTNFRGEGAPDWAVCTDNVPIVPKGGRWSNNYSNPTLQTAVAHFWANDVVGNLQGNFDLVWKTVAQRFKNDPWVIGYDPYNEPFSTETQTASESTFTGQLECFYTGSAHTGFLANGEGATLQLSGRHAGQRRDPDDPVGRQPPPDLRGTGYLLGHRGQHPIPARPDALHSASSSTSTPTAATAARSPATPRTSSNACSRRRPPPPNRTSPGSA